MFKKTGSLFFIFHLFVLLISINVNSAQAGLRLEKSRIIWSDSDTQQSVTLTNDSDDIYLIQSGIFNTLTGTQESSLFSVIPPLYRLDANKQQTMKVLLQSSPDSLPQDRESIFYFSVIAIPGVSPELTEDAAAQLSIGSRLVIKLFYRPVEFVQSPDFAVENVQFHALSHGLCVVNHSPYFITLSDVRVGNRIFPQLAGTMLSPFSQQKLAISDSISVQAPMRWRAINDYGGDTAFYSGSVKDNKEQLCQ
ncbi:fimbrial biogenesis chaperone [Providencia sp. PROV209]|uniref:fimbrial biogenesis chaperone n=1 Tax=Providencia sp. PROV209 TaxID=2949906 RepID=UPI002349C6C3|nr:molecular chaperone [Providencia sp. PROV209]